MCWKNYCLWEFIICIEFSSRDKLKKHNVFKHSSGEVHKCSTCDAKFAFKNELNKHTSVVHDRKEACICSLCGKNLANKQSLKLHISSVHEGKNSFTSM